MKETVRLDRYTCDVCGRVEDVPESHESPLYRIVLPALPARYCDEYGDFMHVSTAKIELCDSCITELLETLETFGSTADYLYVHAIMQERKTEGKNENEEKNNA